MDGIGVTVKNVILRKVKSGQLVVRSPLNFLMLWQNLFRQFTLYTYLKILSSQKIEVWLERSIKRWKYISLKENVVKMAILKSFFLKFRSWRSFSHAVVRAQEWNQLWPCWNQRKWCVKFLASYNEGKESGYVVQYVINGTMQDFFFMSNLSHPLLLYHISRLY